MPPFGYDWFGAWNEENHHRCCRRWNFNSGGSLFKWRPNKPMPANDRRCGAHIRAHKCWWIGYNPHSLQHQTQRDSLYTIFEHLRNIRRHRNAKENEDCKKMPVYLSCSCLRRENRFWDRPLAEPIFLEVENIFFVCVHAVSHSKDVETTTERIAILHYVTEVGKHMVNIWVLE